MHRSRFVTCFWRIPACAVLLCRQNVVSVVSGRTQTGVTKMAQWRHSHRVFGLYRFLDYYPVLHGLCNREQQPYALPSHLATGLSHHLRDFAVGDSRRCRRKRPAGDAHFRLLSPVPFGSRRCGVRIVSLAQGSISAMAMFQQQPAQLTQLTIVIDN